jgi:hypothetical protein
MKEEGGGGLEDLDGWKDGRLEGIRNGGRLASPQGGAIRQPRAQPGDNGLIARSVSPDGARWEWPSRLSLTPGSWFALAGRVPRAAPSLFYTSSCLIHKSRLPGVTFWIGPASGQMEAMRADGVCAG